ncbi:MAG: antitoxin VapB family protein [Candidatus Thorarchaeota archaeon]|nr:antitoxin VapB family protein [Candidatus Thorarchaeota archaeon]
MGKNIMISNEIYVQLQSEKRPGESFSELIRRLLNYKRVSLLDLAGTWPFSDKVTSKLEAEIAETWQTGWRE